MASIIGSGINGNIKHGLIGWVAVVDTRQMASIIGSGINGNSRMGVFTQVKTL